MQPLDERTTLEFAVGDFATAWRAVAFAPVMQANRGNFLFAFQAMALLELASRLCDGAGALEKFTAALRKRNPRYFTILPMPRVRAKRGLAFPRSDRREPQRAELLEILFDVVRNGLAHQYAQKHTLLSDGHLHVIVTGADVGRSLDDVGPADEHLGVQIDESDLWIMLRTDIFFRDVRDAARECSLERGRLSRVDAGKPFAAQVHEVFAALRANGHPAIDFKARLAVGAPLSPTGAAGPMPGK